MTLEEQLKELKDRYDVVAVIDLDPLYELDNHKKQSWFRDVIDSKYKAIYENNQRLVFTLSRGDRYIDETARAGYILTQLQHRINEIDVSNFFVILLTTDQTQADCYTTAFSTISTDPVPITIKVCEPRITTRQLLPQSTYNYNSLNPIKVSLDDLSNKEKFLLTESKTFCIYPWIHFHAYPTGKAYPCCMSDMRFPIGDMHKDTIREIWNQEPMREMRRAMLNDKPVSACVRCYEQEAVGFMSGRRSANKHHGHHINRVHATQEDGTLDQFELTYWDIRFSNLCNLRCRSCGHIFSSQWYQDQAIIGGPEWKKTHQVLNYAGRFEIDAYDQLIEHLDHVEQIYFAGGEPLLMEEHYRILDELVKRELFDVRLIYNSNFTHTDLKGKSVFEYWKLFKSVAVGASLDDMGPRGEYIRKGTDWAVIEQNRRDMLETCPQVDFYISPTLSIMNAMSLPKFHRDWVEKGLIKAQDLNVNILQDPPYYRIDIARPEYKEKICDLYREHLDWLKPQDPLKRASTGFESAINFIMATDNTHLLETFWNKTHELDKIRNENILEVIPELKELV